MNLVLFGPPGAGKGTQSQLIAEKFNMLHVSTGDLLRAAMKNKTRLGVEAQKFVDSGALVPDSIMLGLIKEILIENPDKGILFDGYPRNVAQAESLDQLLKEVKSSLSKAIFFEVERDLLQDRLTGRRVCNNCGATFHVKLKPPQRENVCDVCNGKLVQRPDDHAEVIENRLDVYDKSTLPLKDYYQNKKLFVSIDGVGEPQDVFERIKQAVK